MGIGNVIFRFCKALSNRTLFRVAGILTRIWHITVSGYTSGLIRESGNNVLLQPPFRIIGHRYISWGHQFSALYNLRIEAYDYYRGENFTPDIRIGNNVSINTDCHIACIVRIDIGNNVLIASRVFITDHFHGNASSDSISLPPAERPLVSRGPVKIGNNVWIGEGVCIMPGVEIGENSIVGANAVVTKSFPHNSIIAGVPARLVKKIDQRSYE